MKTSAFLLFFCLCFLLSHRSYCQKPRLEREPSWISKNDYDYHHLKSLDQVEEGYLDVVLDRQVNIAIQAIYVKKAVKIITEAGLQNRSEIAVSYDPAYQHVSFHSIRIIRDGHSLNKLDLSKMKTIQQESELSRSIYNGSLTALYFLEDTRKGDVIEYSYTVYGFNPVLKGKYFTSFETQYSVPVNNLYFKILCPEGKKLQIKNRLTGLQPAIAGIASARVYEWKLTNVPALRMQVELPDWYNPYPQVMVSEFESWSEINKWALSLFQIKKPLTAAPQIKLEELRSKYLNPEARILSVLRFVQDEVRYLGIEMGVNSHRPNHPEKIFRQRFGDCKDKTLLLCTLLQSLDIDAAPVLINTKYLNHIGDWLPSPLAFSHATVRVKLHEKNYWLDPTISFQRGGIDDISYPDYKCGLVLTDSTTGLTTTPLQEPGQVVTKESFKIKDLYGPAILEVSTRYTGSFADDLRSQVNNTSLLELQKTFLDFYAEIYNGTKLKDSLRLEDDEKTGTITSHEYYSIEKLWSMEKGEWKASFDGMLIGSILKKAKNQERKMPLALAFPANYTEKVEVQLPEAWEFNQSSLVVNSPAFSYSSYVEKSEKSITLNYTYKALEDYISPENTPKYLEDYDKIRKNLGYELSKTLDIAANTKQGHSVTGGNLVGIFVILLIFLGGFIYWSRR